MLPPTLLSPLSDPRLNARPWERLLIRTKPVIGPSSPSFSILRLASASSPEELLASLGRERGWRETYQIHSGHISLRLGIGSRPSMRPRGLNKSCLYKP